MSDLAWIKLKVRRRAGSLSVRGSLFDQRCEAVCNCGDMACLPDLRGAVIEALISRFAGAPFPASLCIGVKEGGRVVIDPVPLFSDAPGVFLAPGVIQ
jgi:hypothetical protein